MKTILLHIWSKLRTSFWFLPSLIVSAAACAGWVALAFDQRFGTEILSMFPHLRDVSAAGVRSFLSTAATSVLTLAGVTFSATLVALTLASSQFGGRLLRNFIRSIPNQAALGVLLGNFVLCLIVLRSVRSAEDGVFIPHAAALVAFVSTLGSLATFIYFIHHIAVSLQADKIVANVYAELDEAIDIHFPDDWPDDREEREAEADRREWKALDGESPLPAPETGFVQAVNIDALVSKAAQLDLKFRVLRRPGEFVNRNADLLAVAGASAEKLDDELVGELVESIIIGRMRTAEQDFEYCLRQLVEVAMRALSPGINDPFTAMNCIDFLGAALAKVATRKLPKRIFCDSDGTERVWVRPTAFGDLLDTGFHQIRQTAGDRTDIGLRMLQTLENIATSAGLKSQRESIMAHAENVAGRALEHCQADCDRSAIEHALERIAEKYAS